MKSSVQKVKQFFFMLLLFFMLPTALYAADSEKPPNIYHDRKTDSLTIDAKASPLSEVLAKVGALTGVEILLDKDIKGVVTVKFRDIPVEEGLKKVFRAVGGLSHAMVYSKGEKADDPPVLISVTVLPEGKKGKPDLVPAMALEKEASIRGNMRTSGPVKGKTASPADDKRWQARLDKLSPEMREKLLAQQEKMEEQRKKSAERREERRKEQDERRERKRQEWKERRMKRFEHLKETNPEEYERRVKKLEERENRRVPREEQ